MKKILVTFATVLAIGTGAVKAFASTDYADKSRINIDYTSAFSENNTHTVKEFISATLNAQAATGGALINGNGSYVDNDGDGICDNYADGTYSQNGMGYGHGLGNGGYVDNDGDGICDNYANGTCPRNGTGYGRGLGNGGYVDNDSDGICDNYVDGARPRSDCGHCGRYRLA